MLSFETSSGKIHYRVLGKLGLPALVMLHGLGASSRQFQAIGHRLDVERTVLMIDLPGHGENVPEPSASIGFANFSSLIAELCTHLELRHAVFAGISMGSALALRIAAEHRELVEKVIAIRPAWFTEPAPRNLRLIARLGRWLQSLPEAEALQALEDDHDFRRIKATAPACAFSIRSAALRDHARAHAPVLSGMAEDVPFTTVKILNGVLAPSVVVASRADALHPISLAHKTADALPNARLELLPPRYLEPERHQSALAGLVLHECGVTR